ncbi:hypothetical protein T484DRAFT_1755046 [Baffinella frigidus]|nr:hypothetical protein T484DRAFT_1755046 [Cryptophyta sp. CCMP2293]
MTIDRSFIENFKAIAPQAFDTCPPDNVAVVFIDGQLKLQCPEGIHCYFEFFVALYKRMIDRYLAMEDVKTVILGFDDSTNSPFAKAATQAKRRSRCEVVEWSELRPLDNMIPANHATLLFNRNYKTRVIMYIIQQVTEHCKVREDQRIVVDYLSNPYTAVGFGSGCTGTHTGASGAPEQAIEFEVACPLGECDVKRIRYCPWGDMILDAVDSDYVIIGLCVMERLGRTAPRIFVKRLLLEPGNAALAAAAGDGGGSKKTVQKRKGGSGGGGDLFAAPESGTISMCPRLVAEHVIGVLWKEVQFKKLCGNSAMKNADFETLFKELSTNTSISAFRRERLITPMELCCLVRSANWVQLYWSNAESVPSSLAGNATYGFSKKDGGAVQFDDKVPLPPKVAGKNPMRVSQDIVWPP